jgi:hypothetical protein
MADLILRSSTNQPLTFAELDGNFEYFTGSHSVTGSITASQGFYGNLTGTASYALVALNGGTGNTSTGSLLTTASFADPVITFAKGDGSTFGVDLSDLTVTNTINAANAAYANLAGAANTATLASNAVNSTNAINAINADTASYVLGTGVNGTVASAITASYVNQLSQNLVVTGSITGSAGASFQTLNIGTSGTINGNNILTSANTSQFVTSVNGVLPTAGNVTVSLAGVVTGPSSSLIVSSSGVNTGSLTPGILWVISDDPTPENNGDVFIYTTGSAPAYAGQWLTVAPLDTAAADARYVKQLGDGAITGSFTVSGSGVAINLLGNVKTNRIVDNSNLISISSSLRRLYDSVGDTVLNWENKTFTGTAATASYVDLLAGPNITITQVGTQFEISGSAGGGGGTPGGSDSTIQFNDAGTFGGNGSFRFDDTSFSLLQGVLVSASGYVSHAQGNYTTSSGQYSHAEGQYNIASGFGSHVEGQYSTSSGDYSHAEGLFNTAIGQYSHAEGYNNISFGTYSHAEGNGTVSSGSHSHAEGQSAIARGQASHAEGWLTIATGSYSHAEGRSTIALGLAAHSEGQNTTARGNYSHAEGQATLASGSYSHAEGLQTTALGNQSHTEGYLTISRGQTSHAEGQQTTTFGASSHAEGQFSTASGSCSHAEGYNTISSGSHSHTEGIQTLSYGQYSHAEGSYTTTRGLASHAEGYGSLSIGNYSHAEGYNSYAGLGYWSTLNIVSGLVTFPVNLGDLTSLFYNGQQVIINGVLYVVDTFSLVGGQTKVQLTDTSVNYGGSSYFSIIDYNIPIQVSQSTAFVGVSAHAEGENTIALGGAHSEGQYSVAIAPYSHAEGFYTITNASYQHTVGMLNIPSKVQGAFIIGNGDPNTYTTSNLLHAGGNTVEITGSLQVTGSIQVTGSLISKNTTILTQVSESLNFVDDAAAATGGVPLGGLYRSGNMICIRIV